MEINEAGTSWGYRQFLKLSGADETLRGVWWYPMAATPHVPVLPDVRGGNRTRFYKRICRKGIPCIQHSIFNSGVTSWA